MDIGDFLEQMIRDVEAVKSSGNTAVPIEGLLAYLGNAASDPAGFVRASELNLRRLDIASREWEADRTFNRQQFEHMNHLTIDASHNAIRWSMLANGGGAIALLAFLGNVWDPKVPSEVLAALASSLTFFGWGVFAVAIASGIAYLVQRSLVASLSSHQEAGGMDEGEGRTRKMERGDALERLGMALTGVAVVLILASYVCFVKGISGAVESFSMPTSEQVDATAGADKAVQ